MFGSGTFEQSSSFVTLAIIKALQVPKIGRFLQIPTSLCQMTVDSVDAGNPAVLFFKTP
ncbi:MAG: hypothetical protein ACYC5K_13155 [Saccharofermentanales bacterium]